jgi:hypothetical protein
VNDEPVFFVRLDFPTGKTYIERLSNELADIIRLHGEPISQCIDTCSEIKWALIEKRAGAKISG